MAAARAESSVTDQRVPRTRAEADAVVADTQAADAVFVADERANLFASRNVPDLENVSNCTQVWLGKRTLHS